MLDTSDAVAARARARRQRVLLLVLLNTLTLATGLVASADLRRLETPAGTALRWVQAAVFGDCSDYLSFSVADPASTDTRTPDQICRDLRTATAAARADELHIGLRSGPTTLQGERSTASVVVTRDGRSVTVTADLVRRGGRWRVVRDAATCGSVGCA